MIKITPDKPRLKVQGNEGDTTFWDSGLLWDAGNLWDDNNRIEKIIVRPSVVNFGGQTVFNKIKVRTEMSKPTLNI